MNVLVVGYGSAGRRHAENARALGCEVGVQDADPRRVTAAVAEGFLDATGREDWLADVDAVVVASPASDHAAQIRAWAATPLFVEKPLALSASEVASLGVVPAAVQVGYNWRWHPLVSAFRSRRIEAGDAPATSAALWVFTDRRDWPGAGYADTLLECSHEIDLALDLFGPATLTSARRFDGTTWRLVLAHASGGTSLVMLDDSGRYPASRGLRATWDMWEGGYDVPLTDPRTADALAESYRVELFAFLRGVARGVPVAPTLADGLAVLAICDAARAGVVEATHD